MGHSWQGEVIFPQAMQGSLSNAPSAVSSSSLLSCQARIRKLFCAPFVRTIFTPAHGSNIGQSPDDIHKPLDSQGSVPYGVSQGAFATLSLHIRCPDFRMEMQHGQPVRPAATPTVHPY